MIPTDTGPTYPDGTDPELYRTALRDARGTGRCPVLVDRRALEVTSVLQQPDDVVATIGAILVHIGHATLDLSVAHPPTTDAECRRVAAEHVAFCPDQQDPQNGDFYTLARYAGMIRGADSWRFWWD